MVGMGLGAVCPLDQGFSDICPCASHHGALVKMQILLRRCRMGPEMPMRQVLGPALSKVLGGAGPQQALSRCGNGCTRELRVLPLTLDSSGPCCCRSEADRSPDGEQGWGR